MFVLLALGCGGAGSVALDIESAEDIAQLCAENEPEDVLVTVAFDEQPGPCTFGAFGNQDEENGVFTARIESQASLDLPEGAVICDLQFDFDGIDGGQAQDMEYDDNFLLVFGGAVLATSYAPLIASFDEVDDLPIYDWEDIVGHEMQFSDIDTWCLGEEEGDSTCEIPPPETDGTLSLDFGGDLVDSLAYQSLQSDNTDFLFVATGDNDSTDCSHKDFEFMVNVPVVQQ
ncbi:MAG: hypothetical protein GY913_16265 [Proteobacteria bacterium]|nr:hypothetical protein [Pseudomonadota bacterium]MCP4918459.1 hypothetical protein [Pseudomonadota bacterium]